LDFPRACRQRHRKTSCQTNKMDRGFRNHESHNHLITSLVASRNNFGSDAWSLADELRSLVVLGHSTAASFQILEKHDFREQVEVTP
jgi:hypothetical protein